jgi:hypothetical protein
MRRRDLRQLAGAVAGLNRERLRVLPPVLQSLLSFGAPGRNQAPSALRRTEPATPHASRIGRDSALQSQFRSSSSLW